MATKKTTNPEKDETLNTEPAEEPVKAEEPAKAEGSTEAKLKAEIAKLKAMLGAQKTGGGQKSDFDRVKEASADAAARGIDPWTVEIEILVPHREKTEDSWYWVNVNGVSAQIPANDRYQKIKLPWANVLVDYLKAEKRSLDYQDTLEVYDPVTNPH